MIPAAEIQDSAALISVLDWIVKVRKKTLGYEFIINQNDVDGGREIVMPNWLYQQMLSDLEIYARQKLTERGIEYIVKQISRE